MEHDNEFNKVTSGFVTQRFRKSSDGLYQCIWHEFTAGDDVQYENLKGETIPPPNYDYQEYSMTLLSDGHIIFALREILQTLDVGGEQSRQFAEEISKLKQLIRSLDPGNESEGVKYVISRSINGICLNGREFLLTSAGDVMTFDTEISARSFANTICTGQHDSNVDLSEYAIDICRVNDHGNIL